jgi:hypothetical protein
MAVVGVGPGTRMVAQAGAEATTALPILLPVEVGAAVDRLRCSVTPEVPVPRALRATPEAPEMVQLPATPDRLPRRRGREGPGPLVLLEAPEMQARLGPPVLTEPMDR